MKKSIFKSRLPMKNLFSLFLFIISLGLNSDSRENRIKLYISYVNFHKTIPDNIKQTIKSRIKLNVLEKTGTYMVVDDNDVAVMNKKAAQLMKQGCDEKICMQQIAEAINADEIIYGDIYFDGDRLKFVFSNIIRDNASLIFSTKSVVEENFFESQYEHFIKEITLKLIDPKYKINKNPEIVYDDKINLVSISTGKIEGLDIDILKFESKDNSVSRILEILKKLISEGDDFYNRKSYEESRKKYLEVVEKISSKLTLEKRTKIKSFEDSVKKRISATYIMDFKTQIETVDEKVKQILEKK